MDGLSDEERVSIDPPKVSETASTSSMHHASCIHVKITT